MEYSSTQNINRNAIILIYNNIINLFDEYNISIYLDKVKKPILDYLSNLFLNINDLQIFTLNINNIKEIIKKYAKVKLINENIELSILYKNKDIELFFDDFCFKLLSSKRILNKDELFMNFKNSVLSNTKIQDPKFLFNETLILNDVEIKFIDIKDKLFDYLYTSDLNKYVDMYICNNNCECTQQKLCNLRNDILQILYSTLIYKPTNIIMLDLQIMQNTNVDVDDNIIYSKLYNFLTSRTFDVYTNKTFPQIYLPS